MDPWVLRVLRATGDSLGFRVYRDPLVLWDRRDPRARQARMGSQGLRAAGGHQVWMVLWGPWATLDPRDPGALQGRRGSGVLQGNWDQWDHQALQGKGQEWTWQH